MAPGAGSDRLACIMHCVTIIESRVCNSKWATHNMRSESAHRFTAAIHRTEESGGRLARSSRVPRHWQATLLCLLAAARRAGLPPYMQGAQGQSPVDGRVRIGLGAARWRGNRRKAIVIARPCGGGGGDQSTWTTTWSGAAADCCWREGCAYAVLVRRWRVWRMSPYYQHYSTCLTAAKHLRCGEDDLHKFHWLSSPPIIISNDDAPPAQAAGSREND